MIAYNFKTILTGSEALILPPVNPGTAQYIHDFTTDDNQGHYINM